MAIEITNPPAWPQETASAGANMGTRSVLGSAGVGLASSAADTAIGALFNQAFAKRNAKIQYNMWKKMFDYQADYNSPLWTIQIVTQNTRNINTTHQRNDMK